MFRQDRFNNPIILIVDDQPSNVLALEQAIHGLGQVLFATDGCQALKIAQQTALDLVLLDIEMPGMDGYEICAQMRAMSHLSETSIIFVTSHTEVQHEIDALAMGGADFLHKPLNLPIVQARVRTHLELQRKTKQLAFSQKNLSDIVFNLPVFLGQFDAQLNGIFCNDQTGLWACAPGQMFVGKPLLESLGQPLYEQLLQCTPSMQLGEKLSFDIVVESPGAALRYCDVTLLKQGEDNFLILINDITARKMAELALGEEKERIRVMLESIADAVIATDLNGLVTFMNSAAEQMTGWKNSDALGLEIEEVMPLTVGASDFSLQNPIRICLQEQRAVGMAIDASLVRKSGEKLNVEDCASPVKSHTGEVVGAIIVFHDVSHARQMAIQMTQLANFDVLTGLPNRELLRQKAEQALSAESRVALILLDLDNFKAINNAIGHAEGDLILQKIAIRLKSKLSDRQLLSRRGGDEFMFLLPEVSGVDSVRAFIDSVINIISEVYFIGDKRINLTASVGVSLYPDDAPDLEALFRHADTAMYNAKHMGKNQYSFFAREIEDRVRSEHEIAMQLYDALEQQAFAVHYQPKYSKHLNRFTGAEALIRWNQTGEMNIPPSEFIPIAEESGLIVPLGEFVLKKACEDCKAWQPVLPGMHVAVNVSAIQFEQSDFVGAVKKTLIDTGLEPSLLELEVTEGVLARDIAKMLHYLNELRAIGVSIAIDDFGTGYSSLTYLKYFPISVLKIDQGFIKDVLNNQSNHGIVEAIIRMAGSLKLNLVAEGVETEDIASELSNLGCDVMQGYFFAKPLAVTEMIELVSEYSKC